MAKLGFGGMKLRSGSSVKVFDALKQIALGAGIGIAADGAVEITRVPVLNDTGTFGNSHKANFTLFIEGISIAGIAAGVVDIGLGKGILTFSRSMIFYLVGILIGISFYENTLVNVFNIRKFNPYNLVGKYVPPVLPSSTQLPFISASGGAQPLTLAGKTIALPSTG